MAIISLNDGPFLTMVAMGTAGLASIPYMMLVASVIPLLVGIILGNLDPKMRKCLSDGGEVTIMVLGFALGANMSLRRWPRAVCPVWCWGLITVSSAVCSTSSLTSSPVAPGIAGAAISSVGGNAVATPAALAAVDSSLAATAAIATPQVAAAVVVTAILCPFMTSWISKHTGKEVKTTFSQVEEKVARRERNLLIDR